MYATGLQKTRAATRRNLAGSPSSPAAVGRRESSALNACHSLMHCGGTPVSSDDAFQFERCDVVRIRGDTGIVAYWFRVVAVIPSLPLLLAVDDQSGVARQPTCRRRLSFRYIGSSAPGNSSGWLDRYGLTMRQLPLSVSLA